MYPVVPKQVTITKIENKVNEPSSIIVANNQESGLFSKNNKHSLNSTQNSSLNSFPFHPTKKRRILSDDKLNRDDGRCVIGAADKPLKVNKNGVPATDSNGSRGATAALNLLKSQKKFKREVTVQTSVLNFDDVGGMEKTLKELCEQLLHIKHPELYRHIGLPPPRGFLLHGPPGCGKTLLAQAIAGVISFSNHKLKFQNN